MANQQEVELWKRSVAVKYNYTEKVCCKKVALLNMQLLQKVLIYEKGIKKVVLQKKSVMRNIAFLKKQLFAKSCFFEKVGAVQKNVLRKSSSTVDIFRISYSQDLVARQKFHSGKVAILKKKNAEKTWLF